MCTDGVALWKSSRQSLWPIYLAIANLPPSLRMKKENLILCGLWLGDSKPPMHCLLKPTVTMLRALSIEGVQVRTPVGVKVMYGELLFGVFDLVAKAPILNMRQFNGYFGCPTCLHPGSYTAHALVYPPKSDVSERTHLSMLEAAQEAESLGASVNGIIGKSVLATSLDLVDSIPVDYMHCALEGVAKWLLSAWTSSKNHGMAYSIRRHIGVIDTAFIQQRPPHDFTRPTRSIVSHLKYWKASEFRTWVLFYALPLLLGSLPPLYLHHTALLVTAIHILLRQHLTEAKIAVAEEMLQTFYELLPELYGEGSCTANAHSLTHMAKFVRLWGPLWTHSAFGFESMNGHLTRLFHSRSHICDQLVFSIELCQTLQQLRSSLFETESEATLEFLSFFSSSIPRKSMSRISANTYTIGQPLAPSLSPTELTAVQKACGAVSLSTMTMYGRLYANGFLYHSKLYNRGQGRRNSCICCFRDSSTSGLKFGEIQKFLITIKNVAVIKELKRTSSTLLKRAGNPGRPCLTKYAEVDLTSSFIVEVEAPVSQTILAVPVDLLDGVCVHVVLPSEDYGYVVRQPNNFEHH